MVKKFFKKNSDLDAPEGPIEAGQTLGMKPETVLKKYLVKRNNILKLLRIYSKKPSSNIARELGITDYELVKIENSDELVPFQLVPRFAQIFNVDLKTLLIFLGHTKDVKSNSKTREFNQLAFASYYSGPELTKQEKILLR